MNDGTPIRRVERRVESKHHCYNQHYGAQECVQYWIGGGEKENIHLCKGTNIGPRSVAGILCENIFQVIGINTIWAVVLCSS